MERLESRLCLSTFFEFHVVAQTGNGLHEIKDFVSINDQSLVSFVADEQVYVGDRTGFAREVSFGGRNYGRAAAINDGASGDHQVAASELSFGSQVRRWPSDGNVDRRTDVAATLSFTEPESFDGFLSEVDINDNNQVVFVGLDSTGGTPVHKLRVRDSLQGAVDGRSIEIGSFPAGAGIRPQISNTVEVVFRSPSGESIHKTDRLSDRFRRVAGLKEGFAGDANLPAFGRSPGISDDGHVVVFFGNHPHDNRPGDGLGGGPGIFSSILKPGGNPDGGPGERQLFRLAGIPGELGYDAQGNPIRLLDFATHSTVSKTSTTDSRVGIGGSVTLKRGSDSQMFVTFLANDPRNGNSETLWRLRFHVAVDMQGQLSVSPDRPEAVARVGAVLVDRLGKTLGTVADLEIYDPVSNRGDIAFWTRLSSGSQAVVLSLPLRKPVLVVPGIAGTFAKNNYIDWLMTRGVHPDQLEVDPLAGFYNDIIATLQAAGYREGRDLFVANYDWRLLPGPIDPVNRQNVVGTFDGVISGLQGHADRGDQFSYGVDYLLYWLKEAVEAWRLEHPNAPPLSEVDVIAHSTGGLVTRTYIQSPDVYNQTFTASFGTAKLPRIDKFVMVGVPNRGAAKAWNPLNDNFIDDVAFAAVLSKVIKGAYEKQFARSILGPDDVISFETDPIRFIERYVPTVRTLLATYDFLIQGPSPPTNVNSLPTKRNNLTLDLNAGFDAGGTGDPNRFATLIGRVIDVYGVNAPGTPQSMTEVKGPLTDFDIFSFGDIAVPHKAKPNEIWYTPVTCGSCGDGTVPLDSAVGQFLNDPRIRLLPFTRGVNTQGKVGHTELLSNIDVQAAILRELGREIDRANISTNKAKHGFRNITNILMDPVEGFLMDGKGRRLGFTEATGPLSEIPGSVYLGEQDGAGWILGPVDLPLTWQLVGQGADHFAEVSGTLGTTQFGVDSRGFLAVGERKHVDVLQTVNYPPLAVDDAREATAGTAQRFDVLANDSDPDGHPLRLFSLDTTSTRGTASITADHRIEYTAPNGFEGIDVVRYTIRDSQDAEAAAELRIAVPGRPRILGVQPEDLAQLGSLRTITVDFSHAMNAATAAMVSHYQVLHETLGRLPIAAASYTEPRPGLYRATLTLDAAVVLTPGKIALQVDGRRLLTATGLSIGNGREDLMAMSLADRSVTRLEALAGGQFGITHSQPLAGFDYPQSIVTTDLNADGHSDVVTLSAATSQVVIYPGVSKGSFEEPQRITLPPTTSGLAAYPEQVFIADWNRDGRPDVFVFDNVNDYWQGVFRRVHVYLNDGLGNLSAAPDTPIPIDWEEGGILAVGDFTGDGRPDLALGGPAVDGSRGNFTAKGSVSIYAKDPFLGYSRAAVISTGKREWFPYAGVTADFNGDGRDDLIVSTIGYFVYEPGVVAYMSTPTGLAPASVLEFDRVGSASLAAGDFTGDGKPDLAILHDYYSNWIGVSDGNVISLLVGDGRGNFTELPHQILNRRALGLAGADDFNRDGKLDLLLTASPWPFGYIGGFDGLDHHSTWIQLGNGDGSFRPATALPVAVEPLGLGGFTTTAIDDLNGDGWPDAVLGSGEGYLIRTLWNDQQGSLRSSPQPLLVNPPLSAHPETETRQLVDVNADGLTDMLALVGSQKQLVVYLASPDGSLKQRSLLHAAGSGAAGWIRTGDLNKDGHLDVVVASDQRGVSVLLGNGKGDFQMVPGSPFQITGFNYLNTREPEALIDLNGDGNLDLLVTVSNDYWTQSGWAVYFGDGTGKLHFNRNAYLPFPEGMLNPATTPPYEPVVRDVDGDGRVDILVATGQYDSNVYTRFAFFRGVGNGTFTPGPTSDQPRLVNVLAMETADFNGDGKLDVLGYSQTEVELFLGDGTGRFQLADGYTQAVYDSFGSNPFVFVTAKVGDFNGDGAIDVVFSEAHTQSANLFLNDGNGRLTAGQRVSLGAVAWSLQSVSAHRWTDAASFVAVPTLGPVKLTSPESFPADKQVLGGTGPARATVQAFVRQQLVGQTVVDDQGKWTIAIQPKLARGFHDLRLIAVDGDGQFSAERQVPVLIQATSRTWNNPGNRLDVNDDGLVSPLDALLVINELNSPRYMNGNKVYPLPPPTNPVPPYLDVNNDGLGSPLDVLMIINYLNRKAASEGEAAASPDRLPWLPHTNGGLFTRRTSAVPPKIHVRHARPAAVDVDVLLSRYPNDSVLRRRDFGSPLTTERNHFLEIAADLIDALLAAADGDDLA